ncbi:MAG: 16S rRNA (guanine(527)-N(7))-methyltransferase RsmG, partial [Clostridiales bacterium]|nr:16S rRNA (guanine(527)-N(7))-methyltransferase RsmG [Clostridiales bacterium]
MDEFKEGLRELQLDVTEEQMAQFLDYYDLLIEWNGFMNLTAITDFDVVVEKHFLDSLCLVKTVPELSAQKVLDLGTGAGFPGIPLKIVFPDLDLVLMDSVKKKLNFLDEVIDRLGLKKTVIVHGRAEEMARRPEYRQQFDLCV